MFDNCTPSARGTIRTPVSVVARPRVSELHHSRILKEKIQTGLGRLERLDLIDDLLRLLGVLNTRFVTDFINTDQNIFQSVGSGTLLLAHLNFSVAVTAKIDEIGKLVRLFIRVKGFVRYYVMNIFPIPST